MRSNVGPTWVWARFWRAGKMSEWKARGGQKRAASPRSAAAAGERKRSRTMMSSEEEEEMEEEEDEGGNEGDESQFISQVQTQDVDEVGQEKPIFAGQVS